MNEQDQALCMLYAFRYALGRTTTAPLDLCGIIKKNHHLFKAWAKKQIISDIDHSIEHNMAGMQCDVNVWKDLKDFLSDKI